MFAVQPQCSAHAPTKSSRDQTASTSDKNTRDGGRDGGGNNKDVDDEVDDDDEEVDATG